MHMNDRVVKAEDSDGKPFQLSNDLENAATEALERRARSLDEQAESCRQSAGKWLKLADAATARAAEIRAMITTRRGST
jgi:hypothetical protein